MSALWTYRPATSAYVDGIFGIRTVLWRVYADADLALLGRRLTLGQVTIASKPLRKLTASN